MRDSDGLSTAASAGGTLVTRGRSTAVVVRNASLVVIPPRPIPLRLTSPRTVSKLFGYAAFAAACALCGYAERDPGIRKAIDYRLTVFTSPGLSSFSSSPSDTAAVPQTLPEHVLHLFESGRKGPRADRFTEAVLMADAGGRKGEVRASKSGSLPVIASNPQPRLQTSAFAGASLFLTALTPPVAPIAESPPPPLGTGSLRYKGEWNGLLSNASLSPAAPQLLFGGFTENEFRERELRCMATAIYFEARDEPVKGQIAVGQVIMNRIRSPYYPKTVCGVVYQGERMRHGCQFSFTCTGRPLHVTEQPEWEASVRVAKKIIARDVWLDEVGYATHYHATYVKPDWRHELDRVTQIGGHIFYKMKPGTVQVALLTDGL